MPWGLEFRKVENQGLGWKESRAGGSSGPPALRAAARLVLYMGQASLHPYFHFSEPVVLPPPWTTGFEFSTFQYTKKSQLPETRACEHNYALVEDRENGAPTPTTLYSLSFYAVYLLPPRYQVLVPSPPMKT